VKKDSWPELSGSKLELERVRQATMLSPMMNSLDMVIRLSDDGWEHCDLTFSLHCVDLRVFAYISMHIP